MAKPPAMFFYVRDWITDPALSLCSPSTRGIWIDLLCAMWFARERGRLEGTPRSLARLARCTAQEMIRAIKELRASGAASVTCNANVTLCNTDVTLENRRMMRDEKVRLQTRLRVDKHRAKPCNAPSNAEVTPPSAVSAVSASATDCKTKPKTPAAKPPGFDEFYAAYPRKVAKIVARRAWVKAKDKPPLDAILKALEAQKASEAWTKDGGQYIPHPATWLNQGRWDDEVDNAQRPQSQSDYLRPAVEVIAQERKTRG